MATLYEDNVRKLLDEKKRELDILNQDPDTLKYKIEKLEDKLGKN